MPITFADRVRSRWRASVIMFLVATAIAEGLTWVVMTFIVFVALSAGGAVMSEEMRRLLMVSVQILVGFVGLATWGIRGIQIHNIDTILMSAGAMEKQLISARIQQEGIPVVNLVGSVEDPG